LLAHGEFHGDYWIQFQAEHLPEVLEFLRSHPLLKMDSFVDLCGVDYRPRVPRFEVVTHLFSLMHHHRIRLRYLVPDETLTTPSLTSFWPAANWQEREAFDMYGIHFRGHPNLQRILSPPGATEFPQRKDYPLRGSREEPEDL
jgi:NADH-quinone oxidoreductase subunit C